MSDLVPYEKPTTAIELPQSPSAKWRIVKAEPVTVAGRSYRNTKQMLSVVLEHRQDNGKAVTIEIYVDATAKLGYLMPLLEWAENMPDGVRLKGYVRESVPWDADPNRSTQYG